MILASMGDDRVAFITQTDHAHLSAEILSLWRQGPREHPWSDELLFAVREHDNGWAEADAAPRVHADGKPHDFLSTPTDVRQEIWQRCVERHVADRPLAALWIVRHALHLHADHAGDPEWAPTMDSWRRLADELMERGPWTAQEVDDGYAWLDLADAVSLAACLRRFEPMESRGFELRAEPGDGEIFSTVGLSPFPLAGATTFRITARILESRSYVDASELALALAESRWQRLRIRVCPASELGIRYTGGRDERPPNEHRE